MDTVAEGRMASGIDIRLPQPGCDIVERTEIGVITFPLAGKYTVNGMVHVIAPLRMDSESTSLRGSHDPRVVQITFGDQTEMSPELGFQPFDLSRQLFEEMNGRQI